MTNFKRTDDNVPAFGGSIKEEGKVESCSLSPRQNDYQQKEELLFANNGVFAQSSPAFGLYPSFGGINVGQENKRMSQIQQENSDARKLYPIVI